MIFSSTLITRPKGSLGNVTGRRVLGKNVLSQRITEKSGFISEEQRIQRLKFGDMAKWANTFFPYLPKEPFKVNGKRAVNRYSFFIAANKANFIFAGGDAVNVDPSVINLVPGDNIMIEVKLINKVAMERGNYIIRVPSMPPTYGTIFKFDFIVIKYVGGLPSVIYQQTTQTVQTEISGEFDLSTTEPLYIFAFVSSNNRKLNSKNVNALAEVE